MRSIPLPLALFVSILVLTIGSLPLRPASSEETKAAANAPRSKEESSMKQTTDAPRATKKPIVLKAHGDVRTDDYYWLRERENPEVISHLESENEYTEAALKHTDGLQEELFEEIVGRIKKDDATVPFKLGDYDYYRRFEEGEEYAVHCRRRRATDSPEEVMLDVNELAEGHDFIQVRGAVVSPGQDVLAYAADTVGRRLYTLKFRNLERGEDLPDEIPGVTGNHAWANDNKTIFYTKQHPETLRWYRIYRHVLGTDPADDQLVFEEADEEFSVWVKKSKSRRYIFIASEQTLSSEYRYLDADAPDKAPTVFLAREPKHEYSIEHLGDSFLVRTNWEAKNFRLMEAPVESPDKSAWQELIGNRPDVYLGAVEIFSEYLAVSERKAGLTQIRIMPRDSSPGHYLDFGEPAYDADFGDNKELETSVLRFEYTSLTTPDSVFDYDMSTRKKTLLKEESVLGGFDKENYATERLWATARDGVSVPISIVYRKGNERDGSAPLLLYAYGSYGYSMDAGFASHRLSLLDRGFAFAIAHVRGGQELGRDWYESGKLLRKKNTFTDFVDCAKHLVNLGYTAPDRLFAMGGSAGGLLMGAVANMAPEVFKGIVSRVPFVDVVTTMLDADIPLTTSEYDEWGDPNEKEFYDYMLSYSPYDQIEAKDYPSILVTAGLHDSQVQYWEPAKYVAKLRELKTDDNLLLLKTEMDAGHGGASGRFRRYRETALAYAFMLDLVEGSNRAASAP